MAVSMYKHKFRFGIRFKAKLDYNQSVRLKVHLSRFTSGVFVHGGVAISYRHHHIFSLYLNVLIKWPLSDRLFYS